MKKNGISIDAELVQYLVATSSTTNKKTTQNAFTDFHSEIFSTKKVEKLWCGHFCVNINLLLFEN